MSRRNADPAASKGAVLTFSLSEFSRCVYPFRNEIIVVHLCNFNDFNCNAEYK